MKAGKVIFSFLFVVSILAGSAAAAQEVHRIAMEQTMTEYLDAIADHADDTTKEGKKNLWAANIGLMAYLKNMCELKPNIITEEFQKVGDIDGSLQGINIVTSEDKRFRLYCWDTWTSKKLHRFNTLAQYRVGDAVEIMPWADIAEKQGKMGHVQDCYSEINTVYDKDNRPIYLVMSFSINEGYEGAHEIQAYTIDTALTPVAVFNYYGELKSSLKVSKDKAIRGSWSEDDTNIKISPDGPSVYVPVVRSGNPNTPVQKNEKRYHVYQFNGREFVYKENLNN